MKIPYSKKELYRDNCKMRDEIENLLAKNSELVILQDQSLSAIDEINKRIAEHNKKVEGVK